MDDYVHVLAKKINDNWTVNSDFGWIIYEPDLLISSTSVTNSLFCKRKSVLKEKLLGFEPNNHFMITGTIIHNLLQTALRKKSRTLSEIEKIANESINSPDTIRRLFECGMTQQQLKEEMNNYIPKTLDFINTYVTGKSLTAAKKAKKDCWNGVIDDIADIEENIWCPSLGLKGKIDVSVRCDKEILPLELKTGRASMSLEHKGQVLLYISMMNKVGYNVSSGLLLYLKEGILKDVPMNEKEVKQIIMLRNELAYYLRKEPVILNGTWVPEELPEPIDHPACKKCAYNVICTSYIKYNGSKIKSKSLQAVEEEMGEKISESHLKYFIHWSSLIALEGKTQKRKKLSDIFTISPKERQLKGKCLINLKVKTVGPECNGIYEHHFEKSDQTFSNLISSGFVEGTYVVVSTDLRPAISCGFIKCIETNSLVIDLDRDLLKRFKDCLFHVDSYDSNNISTYNLASLGILLELTPKAQKLREIIIDKKVPEFDQKLPKVVATKGLPILKRLNKVQQKAVLKAIAAKDYLLIKGMPGTGKTSTIVALVQLLVELGKTVLITSHTHSAVDNVCMKLIKFGVKLLRLGTSSKFNSELNDYSEYALTKHCKSPEELESVYNSFNVVAVTCLGSGHALLSKRTFDVSIVDESTQVLQTSVIRPLYCSKTFILIGDPDQLPAVVKNTEAIKLGMTESLFDRLNSPESMISLTLNYRMNKVISAVANALTYKGELLTATELTANATLKLAKIPSNLPNWLRKVIDEKIENSVKFINTGPVWNLKHEVKWFLNSESDDVEELNYINIYEAAIIFKTVKGLINARISPQSIGVIATYRIQVAQIRKILENLNVECSTVDQFQGRDKDVIIYSCCKTRDVKKSRGSVKFDLLEDNRRLTVAITRAKKKLILVGDVGTLNEYSTFKRLLPAIKDHIIDIMKEESFTWEDILNII